MNWLFSLLIALLPSLSLAQVVSVEFKDKGFLFSDAPTLTFLWQAKQPKATLVFIPGGEGKLGLTLERTNLGGFYGATLRPLSDDRLTSGSFNVVVFDSPVQLPSGTDYPYSRQSSEHLLRIQSVVNYYKDKFGLPVWLMGHSNGAVSITEFYKLMQKNKNEKLIDGAVYSSARNGATFNEETQIPIFFWRMNRTVAKNLSLQDRCKSISGNKRQIKPSWNMLSFKAESRKVKSVPRGITCSMALQRRPMEPLIGLYSAVL